MHTTLSELVHGQPFTFINPHNGEGEYVKEGDSHYRKAGNPQNVCLPISSLPAQGGCRVFLIVGP